MKKIIAAARQFDGLPPAEKSDRGARAIGIAVSIVAAVLVAAALVFALAILFPQPAAAGGGAGSFAGATEVTQIANNVELGIATVEQQLQTLESVEQTILARLQQVKNSIGEYTAPFQKTYDQYVKIKETMARLERFKGSLEGLEGRLEGRLQEFGNSRLSWDQWLSRERKWVAEGNASAVARVKADQQVIESTSDSLQSYQKAAAGLEASQGVNQSVRMLGPMLQQLGGDLNKLIVITATANQARDLDRQDRLAEKQAAAGAKEDQAARQKALDEKWRNDLKSMGVGK